MLKGGFFMATQAQIQANRQNAQKSTGPKTSEGKAAVSQNAVKHGLFAAEAVISVEDPADYELYRDEYLAELAPVGMVESMLAERIVSLSWRLQRAERMHNEAIDVKIERESPYNDRFSSQQNDSAPNLILGWIVIKDLANSRVLERLELYERRIENSLYKTINRLKQYQVIRQIKLDETRKHQPVQAIPIPIKDNQDEAEYIKRRNSFADSVYVTLMNSQQYLHLKGLRHGYLLYRNGRALQQYRTGH